MSAATAEAIKTFLRILNYSIAFVGNEKKLFQIVAERLQIWNIAFGVYWFKNCVAEKVRILNFRFDGL